MYRFGELSPSPGWICTIDMFQEKVTIKKEIMVVWLLDSPSLIKLLTHVQNVPTHYLRLITLWSHQITHTGVRSYLCRECTNTLSLSINLKSQQKMHTGVEPYSCTECTKTFSHGNSLQSHQTIHTGVKPYYVPNVPTHSLRLILYNHTK